MNIVEIIVASILFIVDRVIKHHVIHAKNIYRFFSWFSIKGATNTGLAFSIFDNKITIYVVAIAFLVFFSWMLLILHKKQYIFGSYLILFGGASNLFDRLYYSGVVDYIQCTCFSKALPVFNVADIMIVCGVSFAIFSLMSQNKYQKELNK